MEFNLQELGGMLKRHIYLILFLTAGLMLGTGLLSFYWLEPVYEATSTLLVQSSREDNRLSYDDLSANRDLVKTYIEIFKSRRITEDVIRRLKLPYSAEELLKKVEFSSASGSLITRIAVVDRDPQESVRIANGYAQSFMDNIRKIMKIDNVSVLDEAALASTKQVWPRPFLNLAISMILGLLAGFTLALLRETLRQAVHTEAQAEQLLALPSLGAIPSFRGKDKKRKLVCRGSAASLAAEAYRTLRTNIQYDENTRLLKSLLFTSTQKYEGKTTTVANLALTMADAGKKVVVIDGDLRQPSLHLLFGRENNRGLAEILLGKAGVTEVQVQAAERLDLIFAGTAPSTRAELLETRRLRGLMHTLQQTHDLILVDSPPVLPVADAQILANCVDGVVLVIDCGRVPQENIRKAKLLLERVNAKIIGTVLNKKQSEYHRYYSYARAETGGEGSGRSASSD